MILLKFNLEVSSPPLKWCDYFCSFTLSLIAFAIDTITPSQFIKGPGFIISNGSVFKLGFFSPAGSTNRYVGIWYNEISVPTVIWVANRDKPLTDSSGIVTISEEDTGNLVLQEVNSSNGGNDGRIIWESFPHPTDSFLPKMRLSLFKKTGESQVLTSWKSPSDPSIGSFSVGGAPLKLPEVFMWNGSCIYWRTGPWNGQNFLGVLSGDSTYLHGINVVTDKDEEIVSMTYSNESILSNYVLNSQGKIVKRYWDDGKKNWGTSWLAPETECDVYSKCGAFGSCNSQDSPICSCLRGFEPKNKEEWSRGNWTSGCVRRTQLQCKRKRSGGEEGKEDGFLKLKMMKVPDAAESSSVIQDECESQCLKNCSCLAYAYDIGIGCMLWSGKLIDIQKFPHGGVDLYLRLANSELGSE